MDDVMNKEVYAFLLMASCDDLISALSGGAFLNLAYCQSFVHTIEGFSNPGHSLRRAYVVKIWVLLWQGTRAG
ncbi:hypothetical protein LY78DRAFT_654882 [Colletotrichum sublineola]|nr:hypothetical protein LY78DRAFT_654882 [Colletotrichum sublineola]